MSLSRLPARPRSRRYAAIVLAAAISSLVTANGGAQEVRSSKGFLLGTPAAHLGISAGWTFANARSDLFDEVTDQLTLDRSDFSGPTVTAEFGFRLGDRIDFTLDAGYTRINATSEFRHLVDNNNQPIEQTTTFPRVPVTANLKIYLTPRGRSIGRLAWIPARLVPWIGAGGGAEWYRFEQTGDFVNSRNNNVFASTLTTSSWSPALQGKGGVDVSITPRVFGVVDARYIWSRGDVGNSFSGYDKIDLSGVTASVGLSVRL